MKRLLLALFLAGFTNLALAQEHGEPARHDVETEAAAPDETGYPIISQDSRWAGVVVIVILLGMFVPAAVIGPIARALEPDEQPEAHSHDEHAAPGHHGH